MLKLNFSQNTRIFFDNLKQNDIIYHTTKIIIRAVNHEVINCAVNRAVNYINAAVNHAVNHAVNRVTFLFLIFCNIKTTLNWLD